MMQKVVPAILTKDPEELRRQFGLLKDHVKWVQIDIMDGKFVPAVSVSISELGEASQFFNLEFHLMVENPETYLEDCMGAGARRVYFHWESTKEPQRVLEAMKSYPFQRGLAINPDTPVSAVSSLEGVEAALLLSVAPGAQGHEFIPSVLEKAPQVKESFPQALVGMDGGVSEDNIRAAFEKGIDYVAVGSSIWKAQDPLLALKNLSEMVN